MKTINEILSFVDNMVAVVVENKPVVEAHIYDYHVVEFAEEVFENLFFELPEEEFYNHSDELILAVMEYYKKSTDFDISVEDAERIFFGVLEFVSQPAELEEALAVV